MGLNFFSLIPCSYRTNIIQIFTNEVVYIFRLLNRFEFLIFLFKYISLIRISSLIDIVVVDYARNRQRFEINYLFLNIFYNYRFLFKFFLPLNKPFISSITNFFSGAVWFERQAYDMFGLFFQNNPDLRRILTDYGFQGYPLRKDFPLSGYLELRYDDILGSVVYEPVELMQEFRSFAVLGPWHVSTQ